MTDVNNTVPDTDTNTVPDTDTTQQALDRYDIFIAERRAYHRDLYRKKCWYVKKQKQQCAYTGPKIGRCPTMCFKQFCPYHKHYLSQLKTPKVFDIPPPTN